jgi:hypothetical protein
MADFLTTAETAVEGVAFGTNGAAPLPQVIPKGARARQGYDSAIDAVNRLPRPLAACLALALFLDAAIEPAGFEARMQALSAIPQPLWWLVGAVTTFFFGARETHYLRQSNEATSPANP